MLQPSQMKLLLVDDTPANLDVLSETLKPEGYQIAVARSGEKAIDLAQRFAPDLILLDVMMPGLDGFQTCAKLKQGEQTCKIPVIFITAKHEVEDIMQAFQSGCVDYIIKPFHHQEVCARVRTHLQLRAYTRSLQELNAQKNQFLGMAAHDLRGPMNGIIAYSDLMLMQDTSMSAEDRAEALSLINTTTHQMLSLVNNLLDISVIERGTLELQYGWHSLPALIDARLKIYHFKAEMRRIRFHTHYGAVGYGRFDANRIIQVVDNLLTNALKYSPPDATIYIDLEQTETHLLCRVRDEGEGIPEHEQAHLFGDLQTASPRPLDGDKSTGIGLAIVKKVVEAHGGEVGLDSRPGAGSSFRFSLPLQA